MNLCALHGLAVFALLLPFGTAPVSAQASGAFTQLEYFKASNPDYGDAFGWSIAVDGDTMVVGARYEDSNAKGVDGDQTNNSLVEAGAAYVFVHGATGWVQQAYLKASNSGQQDSFGWSVAISGDVIAVGAPWEDSASSGVDGAQGDQFAGSGSGAVYVFVRSGSTWSQEAYVKASNPGFSDFFGWDLGLDGDTLVVGAQYEASASTGVGGSQGNGAPKAGAAYVFDRIPKALGVGFTWMQSAYLKASNTAAGDLFGKSVAISGQRIAIGAPMEDSAATGIDGDQTSNGAIAAGAVYLFTRVAGVWSQTSYVKASNAGAGDQFGSSVSLFAELLAVGAPYEGSTAIGVDGDESIDSGQQGAAYAFRKGALGWAQAAYLKAPTVGYEFGWDAAAGADRVVVSSRVNGMVGGSGSAVVFQDAAGAWSQVGYLESTWPDQGDHFGYAVAMSGMDVVVGAPRESSDAVGIGGYQPDDSKSESGAAFHFRCSWIKNYGSLGGANIAKIGATGPPLAGAPLTIELSGFQGDGVAFVVPSLSSAYLTAFGGTVLVDLGLSMLGPGVAMVIPIQAGLGQVTFPIPTGATGLKLFAQAAMLDLGLPGGLALTDGLEVQICP